MPATQVVETTAFAHELYTTFTTYLPKYRSHIGIALRIEVGCNVSHSHVGYMSTLAQLVDGLVGNALVEASEFEHSLSIVEHDLLNAE